MIRFLINFSLMYLIPSEPTNSDKATSSLTEVYSSTGKGT